jgi:hypothetical protein
LTCLCWLINDEGRHTKNCNSDAYFLFGNIQVKQDTNIYNGVAIKLFDGIMISFDGRLLFHGTAHCCCKCTYGGYVIVGKAVTAASSPI